MSAAVVQEQTGCDLHRVNGVVRSGLKEEGNTGVCTGMEGTAPAPGSFI
ncbi:hypothetical protein [Paenibacillus sp. H1-7]|nr:hypothetical protein [Paenibacillus sp. H1-7]